MTTEEDFQRALDANPDDHNTRLVFADWLQERDDPRAEGYRALGKMRLRPHLSSGTYTWFATDTARWTRIPEVGSNADLPGEWFRLLQGSWEWSRKGTHQYRNGRRAAEDAATLAFAKLPPERRAELLAATPQSA